MLCTVPYENHTHVLRKTSCSLVSKVKHSVFSSRLPLPDLTFELILVSGHFPDWNAFHHPFMLKHKTCLPQNHLCALYNGQTMQLWTNCSTEIPATVVDPTKAAFDMNQICRVQTRDWSCVKSGGAVRLCRWHGACYLQSNV